MVGKIGIRIPSHNSITPSFLDELLKKSASCRTNITASKIRLRLDQKYHIGIVSTGLSYLAYLGALDKSPSGYKTSRLGKKIGKYLLQEKTEEANIYWNRLLQRHKLYTIFKRYFGTHNSESYSLEEFSKYLRKRAHAKWSLSGARSRISRLCELFAEKGLIDYQNNYLAPINAETENVEMLEKPAKRQNNTNLASISKEKKTVKQVDIPVNMWPIRMEVKIELSDQVDKESLEIIFKFLKEMKSQECLKNDVK